MRCEALVVAVSALVVGGCNQVKLDADTRAKFDVVVRVSTDRTRPVEGAELKVDGNRVGATRADGSATLQFLGQEGETHDVLVTCPAGLSSPTKPIAVTLRKLADTTQKPEFSAVCPPATQVVVVAVRAENGPNLPVMHLKKEVARTDASGAATVAMRLAPNETFELELNTEEKGAERLQPRNPTASFTVKDRDDIVTFERKFSLEPAKVRRGGAPKGPIRLK